MASDDEEEYLSAEEGEDDTGSPTKASRRNSLRTQNLTTRSPTAADAQKKQTTPVVAPTIAEPHTPDRSGADEDSGPFSHLETPAVTIVAEPLPREDGDEESPPSTPKHGSISGGGGGDSGPPMSTADSGNKAQGSTGRSVMAEKLIKHLSERQTEAAPSDPSASSPRASTSTTASQPPPSSHPSGPLPTTPPAGSGGTAGAAAVAGVSHGLMEGDDTSSGEEGEEGEWGGTGGVKKYPPSPASSTSPPSALSSSSTEEEFGGGGGSQAGNAATAGAAAAGVVVGTGVGEALPPDFDHESVYKMTNHETGEVYDLRSGLPWGTIDDTAGGSGGGSSTGGAGGGGGPSLETDLFRMQGLIPSIDILRAHAKTSALKGSHAEGGDKGDKNSAAAAGGGGQGGKEAAAAGAGGDKSKALGSKKSVFARGLHKVHKRMAAAGEKMAVKGESAAAGSGSGGSGGSAQPHTQHVSAGHEQTGDRVKVSVHGKDYSEWSSLYQVQSLAAHEGPVWCLAWSQTGMFLASAGQDAVIKVWKVVESGDELPPAWKKKNKNQQKQQQQHGHPLPSPPPPGGACGGPSVEAVPLDDAGVGAGAGDGVGFSPRNCARKWNCPVVREDFAAGEGGNPGFVYGGEGVDGSSVPFGGGGPGLAAGMGGFGSGGAGMGGGEWLGPGFHNAVPYRAWRDHTLDIVDLSWNQNDFLLSASIDRTVRLWHVSTSECLHCFPHSDFVTSVDFHPKNDLLFLSGCFDKRLRVWFIPERQVAAWATTPELITSVCFSPTGHQALAGLFNGQVFFWHTDSGVGGLTDTNNGGADNKTMDSNSNLAKAAAAAGGDGSSLGAAAAAEVRRRPLVGGAGSGGGGGVGSGLPNLMAQTHVQLRYYTQVEARNRRGKFQHGRKVTGLQWLPAAALKAKHESAQAFTPVAEKGARDGSGGGSVANTPTRVPSHKRSHLGSGLQLPQQLLVSTNDSRVRLFQMETFSQLCKFKGLSNENMQIRSSFSSDGKYVISGSENGFVHIWNTTNVKAEALEQSGEHGVSVRGGHGTDADRWHRLSTTVASVGVGGGSKRDRNMAYESFRATHATKEQKQWRPSGSGGGSRSSSRTRPDNAAAAAGGAGGTGGGCRRGDSQGSTSVDRSSNDSDSVARGSSGSGGGGNSAAASIPAITTAAVFAPFATVSLAAAASDVHMLYTDLEQLANSIIVSADYSGRVRFFMRASADEVDHQGDMF